MRNTEKDQNWREMIRKQGELRHFGSMAIRKSSKGDMVSAQEVDLLFRTALSVGMMTPGQLALDMGVSKTIISRLIESLEKKGFDRERENTDGPEKLWCQCDRSWKRRSGSYVLLLSGSAVYIERTDGDGRF